MPLTLEQSQEINDIFSPIDQTIANVGKPISNAASAVTGEINPATGTIFNNQPTGIVGASPSISQLLNSVADIPIPSAAGGVITPSTAANNPASLAGSAFTEVSQLFLRGVVIILGFIFVAVGLSMFNQHKTVNQIINTGRGRESSESLLNKAVKAEKAGR